MTFNDKLLRNSYIRLPVDERPGFTLQQTLPIESATIKQQVDKAITTMVQEDVKYLLDHPEINAIVELLMGEFLTHRPRLPVKFVGDLFSRANMRQVIAEKCKEMKHHKLPSHNWNLQHQGPTDWKSTVQMKLCEEQSGDTNEEDEEEDSDDEEIEWEGEESDEEESGVGIPLQQNALDVVGEQLDLKKSDSNLKKEDSSFVENYMEPLLRLVEMEGEDEEPDIPDSVLSTIDKIRLGEEISDINRNESQMENEQEVERPTIPLQ